MRRDSEDPIAAYEFDEFQPVAYTIGGVTVFPDTRRPVVRTIYRERSVNRGIGDRMHLTVELLRLHDPGGNSPVSRICGLLRALRRLPRLHQVLPFAGLGRLRRPSCVPLALHWS